MTRQRQRWLSPVTAALAGTAVMVTVTGCAAVSESGRTPTEARDNLTAQVHSFLTPSLKVAHHSRESRPNCEGGWWPSDGIYRWEYFISVPYSAETEAFALERVAQLQRDGWMIKKRDLPFGDTAYTASKKDQPLIGVTISTDHAKPLTASGSSECITDSNPPEPKGVVIGPISTHK